MFIFFYLYTQALDFHTLSRSLSIYDMRFVCINHVIYPPVNIMMLFELVLLELGVKFLKLNTIRKKAWAIRFFLSSK